MKNQIYINVHKPGSIQKVSFALKNCIDSIKRSYSEICIVCIGTDRSTGDSLGPLIGYKLKMVNLPDDITVKGDLDSPVHAVNLDEITRSIPENALVIAIDACLGKMDHVGYITVGDGPLKPGSGVNKDLEPIGDIHITGIVNFGGFMDFLVLQNTRLSLVMKLADAIATGIEETMCTKAGDKCQDTSSFTETFKKTLFGTKNRSIEPGHGLT